MRQSFFRLSMFVAALAATLATPLATGCDNSDVATEAGLGARRADLCGAEAALGQDELSDSARLCEHQTLVATLTPESTLRVPFRLVTREAVEYCFRDDNGEAHKASFVSGNNIVAQITGTTECVTQTLPSGDYELRIEHARPGQIDTTPDVVHTRWRPATGPGGTARLAITTNACPGCDLRKKPWPMLPGSTQYGYMLGQFGYSGDYTGADFSGSTCTRQFAGCTLGGWGGVHSSFDGAKFDDVVIADVVGSFGTQLVRSGTVSARGASFRRLKMSGITYLALSGDLTGADFTGAMISRVLPLGTTPAVLRGLVLTDVTMLDRGELNSAEVDAPTWLAFNRLGVVFNHSTLDVGSTRDLSGLVWRGRNQNNIVWPATLAGLRFDRADLSELSFPCGPGTSMAGMSFIGAQLSDVSASGCDLSESVFDQAKLTVFTARNTIFDRSSMRDLEGRDIDLSGSSLSTVPLRAKAGSTLAGLRLNGARGDLVADSLDATGFSAADAQFKGASFVGAKLPDALLDGAKLDTSNWSNAILDGAKLVGATGTGTIFAATSLRGASLDIARFTGATFDAARLDNAHFTRGRVCAGSARGTVLSGANLLDTVIPAESNTYTVDGNKFDCLAVSGQATTVTSSSTLCPDGASGPCTQAPRWVPLSAAPTCCNPWTDNTCTRRGGGKACDGACQCASLACIGGQCAAAN